MSPIPVFAAYSCDVDSILDTVAGLPVHALVVHAVVVLVPLAALGAILMAFWTAFSRRFGTLVVIVAAVGAGAAAVAKESGEQLAQRVGTPTVHADLGKVMPYAAALLFLVILVFWLFDRGIPTSVSRPMWLVLLGAVMVLVSLAAIYWTFRVGDSGARAVWEPILAKAGPAGG
jgi:uncharacterized membrane protein